MKVEAIEIKNFKGIVSENISIKGCNVFLIGPNGSNKTSFIDAVFKPLTGKDLPAKITREGATKGEIRLDLGDYIVETKFNAKKEKLELTVTSPDGAIYKSPRTMLDQLVGVIDFDLNAFFALTPKKKVEFIKNLVGIDFSDLDERYNELFQERTFVNRKVKELAAICDSQKVNSRAVEKVDIQDLQARYEAGLKHNQMYDGVAQRNGQRYQRMQEIVTLIEQLKAEHAECHQKYGEANAWLQQNPKVEMEGLKADITAAITHNAEVDKTAAANAKLAEYNQAVAEQEHLNTQLEEVQAAKKEAIAEAKLPVPGLTFDEEQLYLNGLPFEANQINTAQLIIAGLQINLALMKEVKIARFDGSLLDNKSLAEVEAWAAANDLQLFVEMVDRSGEGMQVVVQEAAGEEVFAC